MANGITERINQSIEHYLRVYMNGSATDWYEHIALAEFAYNRRFQESIKMSPFEADIGDNPMTPTDLTQPPPTKNARQAKEVRRAREFVEEQADRMASLRHNLQAAQDRQKKYYDHNRPTQVFKIGDLVMISTENLSTDQKKHSDGQAEARSSVDRPVPGTQTGEP
jgi:hypothetical protein